MTLNIVIAGLQHETNTFSPIATQLKHFEQADNWPALTQGESVFNVFSDINIPISGFIQQAKQFNYALTPLLWAQAVPSGKVTSHAYQKLTQSVLDQLKALPFTPDAFYLDCHGAMVSDDMPDADGMLLQNLRQLLGEDCFIIATLDLHANVSPLMFDSADMLMAYRTYPHIDMAETGKRAACGLHHYLQQRCKPAKAFTAFDFLIPMTAQCSTIEPNKSLYAHLDQLDQDNSISTSLNMGFPLADTAVTGPTALAYAPTQVQAQRLLDSIESKVTAAQSQFYSQLYLPKQAIEKGLHAAARSQKPVVLADTQDNPGCGGSGDTTGLLAALIEHSNQPAIVASIYDPVTANQAYQAGVGSTLEVALGEKQCHSGAKPLSLNVEVVARTHTPVKATGPYYAGCEIDLGQAVLLRIGLIDIVVTSRNVQAADQAILTHLSAQPESYALIALKSSVHFRADFQGLASDILLVCAPGLNTADLNKLPYQHLRAHMRLLS